MTAKRTLLLICVALVAIAAVPATASAFKIVKVKGGAIKKTTEIHIVFAPLKFIDPFEAGFECETNATIKTSNGEEKNTFMEINEVILASCKGTGFFEPCHYEVVAPSSAGTMSFAKGTLNFRYTQIGNLDAKCIYPGYDLFFEVVSITVGTGAINGGILGGEGVEEIEGFGAGAASASGEMTLGQYSEEGVNQGTAKGVFKVE